MRGSVYVMHKRPLIAAAALAAALVVPSTAQAQILEIGKEGPETKPTCPKTCFAISRTTGYQAAVGGARGAMAIPRDGRIVAWTIALGTPGRKQKAFFDSKLGGEATAQLTILRPGTKQRSRVVAQGEPQRLSPYFGTTVQFALERSIPVEKGWVVALTVPTWAPALAYPITGNTAWRASRARGTCGETQMQTAQTRVLQLAQYFCRYRGARLTYSATLVTAPQPARQPANRRR
jgi:hypothetical protein